MKANNRLQEWFTGDFKRPGGRPPDTGVGAFAAGPGLSAVGGNPGLVLHAPQKR